MNNTNFTFLLLLIVFSQDLIGQNNTLEKSNPKFWIPYVEGELWGVCDTLGNVVHAPKYDSIGFYNVWGNNYAVIKKRKKYGIVDSNFKVRLKPKYKAIKRINSVSKKGPNLIQIGKKDKWGVVNDKGKIIISIKYDNVNLNYLSLGHVFVLNDGKYAIFDLEGTQHSEFEFTELTPSIFGGGGKTDILTMKEGEYYLIRQDRTLVRPPEYPSSISVSEIKPSSNNIPETIERNTIYYLESAKKRHRLDSIDLNKNISTGFWKEKVPYYLLVYREGQKSIFDTMKDTLIQLEFEDIRLVKNYWFMDAKDVYKKIFFIKRNNKWGGVNGKDEIVIPFKYDDFGEIDRYFVETIIKNRYGAITLFSHYPEIPCKYDSIKRYSSINVSRSRNFLIFQIEINSKKGLVGENGAEYFKFSEE